MHRGLEVLRIDRYTVIREYKNNAMNKDFVMMKEMTVSYESRENIWNFKN